MSGGRLLVFAAALVGILGLVGVVVVFREGVRFVPSHGYYSAVAVHSTPDGAIEALYTPCDDPDWQDRTPFPRMPITGFRLEVGEPTSDGERDWETIWRLTIDDTTDIDSVVLGRLPEGATEEVPWPEGGVQGFTADALFSVYFPQKDGTNEIESFRPNDLDRGTVWFRGESMTPEEFAQADRCSD